MDKILETFVRDIHFFINLFKNETYLFYKDSLYCTYTLHLRYKTTSVNAV